mmetsp:Transcript_17869/g.69263  ORF Transcript_17869/g.69263 Transcript_17869/m.69263 type:complete len:279 (+) Transcript_17869:507-1343(+)
MPRGAGAVAVIDEEEAGDHEHEAVGGQAAGVGRVEAAVIEVLLEDEHQRLEGGQPAFERQHELRGARATVAGGVELRAGRVDKADRLAVHAAAVVDHVEGNVGGNGLTPALHLDDGHLGVIDGLQRLDPLLPRELCRQQVHGAAADVAASRLDRDDEVEVALGDAEARGVGAVDLDRGLRPEAAHRALDALDHAVGQLLVLACHEALHLRHVGRHVRAQPLCLRHGHRLQKVEHRRKAVQEEVHARRRHRGRLDSGLGPARRPHGLLRRGRARDGAER